MSDSLPCYLFLCDLYRAHGAPDAHIRDVHVTTVDYATNRRRTLHCFPVWEHDLNTVHDVAYPVIVGKCAQLSGVSNAQYEVLA